MHLHLNEKSRASAEELLREIGVRPSATSLEQLTEFLVALCLFEERNNADGGYQDLWREYGWVDSLHHMKSKFLRVKRRFDEHGADVQELDDAYDLLNYTVFFIRNVKEGNVGTDD